MCPSSCCKAPVKVTGYDKENAPEGQTQRYVCSQCEQPCDDARQWKQEGLDPDAEVS